MTRKGIILNNALDNFAPNDPHIGRTSNTIVEKRRPLTRNVVALSMDQIRICGRRILVGGATSDAVGIVLAQILLDNMGINDAVDSPRVLLRGGGTVFMERAGLTLLEIQNIREAVGLVGDGSSRGDSFLLNEDSPNGDGGVQNLQLPYLPVNSLEKSFDNVLGYTDQRSAGLINNLRKKISF